MAGHRRDSLDLPPAVLHPEDVLLLAAPEHLPRPDNTPDCGGRAVLGVRVPAEALDPFGAAQDAVGAAWLVVEHHLRHTADRVTIGRFASGIRVADLGVDAGEVFETVVRRVGGAAFGPAPAGTAGDEFVWIGLVHSGHALELRADFDAATVDARGLRHALAQVVEVLSRAAAWPGTTVAALGPKSTAELEDTFGSARARVTAQTPGR